MKTPILQWLSKNMTLLSNTASLIGATAVTSALGFVYWWLAARQFTLDAVGFASASVSAMMLLGNLFSLGLGTLLITELPRKPHQAPTLISTALTAVGIAGFIGGAGFALIASHLSPGLQPLGANMGAILTFAAGVSLTTIAQILDQALIGLLRGDIQLWRNIFFSILKLVLLFFASLWVALHTGMSIYAAWAIGNAISLLVLIGYIKFKQYSSLRVFLPQWKMVRKLGGAALQHHALNIMLQIPTSLLPLLVTALLSTAMNAWFYVAWMIASFVFMVPTSLTIVLHAMNSANASSLAQKIRTTMGISCIVILVADAFLEVAAQPVLGIFGHSYALQATSCLRILVLAAFPLIVKNHYLSICRIHDRIVQALVIMIPGGLIELGAAGLGAHYAGLTGICLGWVISIYIETLFMGKAVYRALYPKQDALQGLAVEQEYILTEPLWNMNTMTLPAIKIVTTSMPAQRRVPAASHQTAAKEPLPVKAMPVSHHTAMREQSPVTEMPAQIRRSHPNTPSIWPDLDDYTQGRYQLKPTRLQSYSYDPAKKEMVNAGSKNASND